MSASYVVDLGPTVQAGLSIGALPGPGSGTVFPASGAVVGDIVDMLNANTFTNLQLAGVGLLGSGQLRVAVQTSPNTTSGSFTDPTSGLAAFPTTFESGGILRLNSGGAGGGTFGAFVSGQSTLSGFNVFAGFQRPDRYVRAIALSGELFCGTLLASFIGQFRTIGSGGGYTPLPSSGGISV